jgi:hypothetical protein
MIIARCRESARVSGRAALLPGVDAPSIDGGWSAARRHYAGSLDHQDDAAFRGACAMADAFGDDEPFARAERDDAAWCHAVGLGLEVDEELSLEDEEELVVVVVLVPVILALQHAHADHGFVDAHESLVEPPVLDASGNPVD